MSMDYFSVGNKSVVVFHNKKEQIARGSMYPWFLFEGEVLVEVVGKFSNGDPALLQARIYKNNIDLKRLLNELKRTGGYFTEKINNEFKYVAD